MGRKKARWVKEKGMKRDRNKKREREREKDSVLNNDWFCNRQLFLLDSTNSHHQLGNKWICNGECEENEKEDGREKEKRLCCFSRCD